ncbi:MAG: 2-succinyl-5-enolpyruvyl-6-hydroxy-3-cyclohexene-1-carboxylic-acid synthase [Chromatiaceae bacterium]|nr:2-succinyl-5-enolpyruvyl-6-hydroxy-3-cyclohexene-1-carboxylic-acid synthase [Chromatiaceae bacterium]MCF8015132.1 2-succinyl-5-enolpyruvyl-6-hydroxy-3-cyclohexene-1-carboxylic-acid synthase [Chromatiaceae bacterium]
MSAADDIGCGDIGCLNLRWSLALLEGMVSAGLRHLVLSPGARSTPLLIAAQRLEVAGCLQLTPILDERSAAFFALGIARAQLRPVALLATSGSAPAHWYPAVIEAAEVGMPLLLLSADRPPRLRGWGANQTIDQTRLFGAFVREFLDPGLPQATAPALKAQRALGRRVALVSSGQRAGPVHLNLPFDEPLVPGPACTAAVDLEGAEPPLRSVDAGSIAVEFVVNVAECNDSEGNETGFARLKTGPVAEWSREAEPNRAEPRGTEPHGAEPMVTRLEVELRSWPAGRGLILCGPGSELRTPVSSAPRLSLAPSLWRCAEALALPVLVDPLSGLRASAQPAIAETQISAYDSFLRHPKVARVLRPDWVLRIGRAPVSKLLGQWLEGVPAILVSETGVWSDPSHDALLRLELPAAAVCDALRVQGRVKPRPDWLARWRAAEQETWRLVDASLAQASPSSGLASSATDTSADLRLRPSPAVQEARIDERKAGLLRTLSWSEAQVIAALRAAIPDGEALFCANSMPIRQLDTWWRAGGSEVTLLGNRGASGIDGYLSTLAGINQAGLACWGLVGDLSLCHDLSGLLLATRLDRPLLVLNNGGGHIFDYLPQRGLADFERLWQTPQRVELSALAALAGLRHWRVEDAEGLDAALSEVGLTPGMIECVIDPEVSRQAHLAFWEWIRMSSFPGPDISEA